MADIVHLMRYTITDHPGLLDRPFLCTANLAFVTCPKCIELHNDWVRKAEGRETRFRQWVNPTHRPSVEEAEPCQHVFSVLDVVDGVVMNRCKKCGTTGSESL